MKSIALYFSEGASDKEYHASVEARGSGYVVNFAYGRRGSTLMTGTKTQTPVSLVKANEIYDRLVAEKEGKGYRAMGGARPAVSHVEDAGDESEMLCKPQLLNEVQESEIHDLIWNDEYGMQEKKDGKRIGIDVNGGKVQGSNRKGKVVSLPQEVVDSLVQAPECQLDGELVGTVYHVFDILLLDEDLIEDEYESRYAKLCKLAKKFGPNVQIVPLYQGGVKKEEMYAEFKSSNKEGVVFKKLGARYVPGRPNSGGAQLKFKFYATCSAVVSKVNKQRSVGLSVEGTEIGNVTIPPNHKVPKKGSIVEVRYLYFNKGGALYQPTYLGVRDDLDAADCTMKQLKSKGVEEDAEI